MGAYYQTAAGRDVALFVMVDARNKCGSFKVRQVTWYAGKRKPSAAKHNNVDAFEFTSGFYRPVAFTELPAEVQDRFR